MSARKKETRGGKASRDSVPKTTKLTQKARGAVRRLFKARGLTEAQADVFCDVVQIKAGHLLPVLKYEAGYVGERRTTENAKASLRMLAEHLSIFHELKGPRGKVASGLFQRAWIEAGYPIDHEWTPFDMMQMIRKAASAAAELECQRGKRPISQAEIALWRCAARAFMTATGRRPTSTGSGIFGTIAAELANQFGMDTPSRAVLLPAIKGI